MKRLMQRILVLMAVLLIGGTASKAYDFEVDGIYYNKVNNSTNLPLAEVTFCGEKYSSYNEYSNDIVIPQYVEYNGRRYLVLGIGDSAFRGCNELTSITMNTVSYIRYAAFTGCTALKSVSMNKVESVEEYAFSNCFSLTSIEIPESMTKIGDFMFDGCEALTSVDLPNTITSVGTCSFRWCPKLRKITIPSSVTTIGLKSFYQSGLSGIVLPDSVKDIGSSAFEGCTLVPLLINNINALQENSLKGLNLSSVILVPTVEDIAKVKPYFEGSVYPNTAFCVDSLRSYLGGVEFSLWTNIYEGQYKRSITDVIVADKSVVKGENNIYYADKLLPDTTYEIMICYEYWVPLPTEIEDDIILLNTSSQFVVSALPPAKPEIGGNSIKYKIVQDTIRTEFSTLEPDWHGRFLNSTYSTCEIQSNWDSDKTVSPTEWGAYILDHDFSNSSWNSEEEYREKHIKLKGEKLKANLDGIINATGLQPDREYYFWPYAVYNGKEYLEIWDYIPAKTQLPKLGITDLNITQTTYEAQITASEDEYLSPSEKGVYLKIYSSNKEWVKYKADSTGKVNVTGLIPYESYCVRPYAIYKWTEITQLENYDRDYKHITTKPIKPFTNKQAPYSVNHIDLSVSSGTLDSDLSVVELGVRYKETDYPANSDKMVTIGNLTPEQDITIYPYVVVKYASTGETTKVIGGYDTYTSSAPYIRYIDCVASVTTIKVNEMKYELYDGTFKECGFSTPYTMVGDKAFFTGLNPGEKYNITGYLIVEEGNYKATLSRTVTTPALKMTTLPAKATSNSKAVICAETNIINEETGTGFEFRRIDAPDLVPSTVVYCAVHDGVMEGILNNLSSNTYYKYRPFYKSASGKMYYGDWIGFGTADAYVYFTPTVHTYATAGVANNSVTLNGYALAGSDDILEQGFEYWTDGFVGTRAAGEVMTVAATGQRMSITLNDLQYNTTYRYRAYVKTAKETTYGEEMSFTTGADPAGIGEVAAEDLEV
ncbi:MAG: leucine-rich repeat domain-containing protein, partial [Bacteroidaceae bacterium]|nr:leucine-rich repeat domain-containing protein [Bacteroidaceae bacterium]